MNTPNYIIESYGLNGRIALACGWAFNNYAHHPWISPNDTGWMYPPLYSQDLNKMHEAEKTLSDVSPGKDKNGDNIPSDIARYRGNLCVVCMSNGGPITATASQRAEAFLKTIGKWKE
jgi:hypothetical protein